MLMFPVCSCRAINDVRTSFTIQKDLHMQKRVSEDQQNSKRFQTGDECECNRLVAFSKPFLFSLRRRRALTADLLRKSIIHDLDSGQAVIIPRGKDINNRARLISTSPAFI